MQLPLWDCVIIIFSFPVKEMVSCRCCSAERLDNHFLNMSRRSPVRTWGNTRSCVCNWFSLKVCVCVCVPVFMCTGILCMPLHVCVCVCLRTLPLIKGTGLWSLMATLIFNGKRVVSKEQHGGVSAPGGVAHPERHEGPFGCTAAPPWSRLTAQHWC